MMHLCIMLSTHWTPLLFTSVCHQCLHFSVVEALCLAVSCLPIRFFCLPRLRHCGVFSCSVFPLFLLHDCNISIFVSRILSVMHTTPSVFLKTSFLFLSFSENLRIHRSIT